MPSARLLPNVQRHDLNELPYSPTIWQRIGGPWSLTLRAYLWTAPLAILTQPLVEQSFWNDFGTLPLWLINSTAAYLVFGLVLWLGRKMFIDRRTLSFATMATVIGIAIIASLTRSATIGFLIEPLGLTGVNWFARLPFGAFLGFAWIFTTALIMDSKYRFRLHFQTVVSEQTQLLSKNHEWIDQVRNTLRQTSRSEAETSHRTLQQAMREVAIRSNDPKSIWAKVTAEIKRASIRIALADDKETWTSQKNLSELQGSRSQAFIAITSTPLMNISQVMSFTAIIMFLGASRLFSFWFSFSAVAYGILLHTAIIQIFRVLIRRQEQPSAFGYFIMVILLFISGLVSSVAVTPLAVDMLTLRSMIVAATGFEIVWLIATGFIQYSQVQRQRVIDVAKVENDRLRLTLAFWELNKSQFEASQANGYELMKVAAQNIDKAIQANDLMLGLQAIEFSSQFFAEFSQEFLGLDQMTIENELDRIARTWQDQAEVIWSASGPSVDEVNARRVIAALEICVSKSIRHGNASVISIDVTRSDNSVAIKVTDNGSEHNDGNSGLGVEILKELSNGTWQRDRSGGLNIVTAQFV